MKKRCAGLVAVLGSLVAFGTANAQITFHAVLDPMTTTTRVDSVKLVSPNMTFLTPGWGSQTPLDSHDFTDVTAWPPMSIMLHGTIDASPFSKSIYPPQLDVWYYLRPTLPSSKVLFWKDPGVEESKPTAERLLCLTVSPSVVTGQMAIRLQPAEMSRPIVQIHDAAGNVVRSLDCTAGAGGFASATWNRADESGRLVPKGVYFCRYAEADVIAVRKVLVAH
jgi:hypothetical protein